MNIEKKVNGTTMDIALEGRLDTTTAPQLDAALKESLDGITERNMTLKDLNTCNPQAFASCFPPRR